MYVASYNLKEFLQEAAVDDCRRIRVQDMATSQPSGHGSVDQTSAIVVSRVASEGAIHVARVVVEAIERWERDDDKGMSARAAQALALVEHAIREHLDGVELWRGIYLGDGLDGAALARIHSDQDLWRIRIGTRGDERTRTLEPLAERAP